jgi:pimeloyl-ACP methyl ester carboxylesterase
MDRLADRFHVLAVDLYGYGKSPSWSGDRKLSHADEVTKMETAFRKAGDPFHLIGHSFGGAVALKAALNNPRRLQSLSIFEPVLFALLVEEDAQQPAALEIAAVRDETTAAVNRGELAVAAERLIDYWVGAGSWAQIPAARQAAIASTMPKSVSEWPAAFDQATPLSAFACLQVPTLLITGSESPASSKGVARLLAETLPQVTTREMRGVGHMGPLTHAQEVNAEIESFLVSRT